MHATFLSIIVCVWFFLLVLVINDNVFCRFFVYSILTFNIPYMDIHTVLVLVWVRNDSTDLVRIDLAEHEETECDSTVVRND